MQEGKRLIFNVSFTLCLVGWICTLIAFSTPYWVISWPRVHSTFKRIGMWEVCFGGLILERDPEQVAYHGCWWILATYFDDIKAFIMPAWFRVVQVFVTLSLILEMINLIVMIVLLCSMKKTDNYGKKRIPIKRVQTSTIFIIICALLKVTVVLVFALGFYHDRFWMPRPDLNYMSWSYGVFVVSAFMSIFGTISMIAYNSIVRQEYREPPQAAALPMMKDSAL